VNSYWSTTYLPKREARDLLGLPIEGRLLPMVEEVEPLTLEQLNHATLAWLEREYNRSPCPASSA
jgi:hypothetical protein